MKIGLEVHQRLNTKKLYCNCSSKLTEAEPDLLITRRLHPVFSELGEIDEASRTEYAKRKTFEYQAFNEYEACQEKIDTLNANPETISIWFSPLPLLFFLFQLLI